MGKIDYEVFVAENYEDNGETKTRWTKIGVGFYNKTNIKVILSALPVKGELVLLPPKPKEAPVDKPLANLTIA